MNSMTRPAIKLLTYYLIVFVLFHVITLPGFVSAASLEDAEEGLKQANQTVLVLKEKGLPVNEAELAFIEAHFWFVKAHYARAIQDDSSQEFKDEASQQLAGIDIEDATYDNVLRHTQKVAEIAEKVIILSDELVALESTISHQQELYNLTKTTEFFGLAKDSFEREHLSEAENYINLAYQAFSDAQATRAILQELARSGTSFIIDNRVPLTASGATFITGGMIVVVRLRKAKQRKKRIALHLEQRELVKLLEKAQHERYNSQTLSKQEYLSKIKFYKQRQHDIIVELAKLR